MFSSNTKRLLKNVIRHTDTHNKIIEENDMWRQHRSGPGVSRSPMSRAHMDRGDHDSTLPEERDDRDDHQGSTFWRRQLQKAEDRDPDRWGHGGYRELYPNEFRSDRSRSNSSSRSRSPVKKQKKHKSTKKRKRKRKRSKKEKKEKRHKSDASDSELDLEERGNKNHESRYKKSNLSEREEANSSQRGHDARFDESAERGGRDRSSGTDPRRPSPKLFPRPTPRPPVESRPVRSGSIGNMFSRALRAVTDEQIKKPVPRRKDSPKRSRSPPDRSRPKRERSRSRSRWRRDRSSSRSPSLRRRHSRSPVSRAPRRDRESRPVYRPPGYQVQKDSDSRYPRGRTERKRRYNSSSSSSSSSSRSRDSASNREEQKTGFGFKQ